MDKIILASSTFGLLVALLQFTVIQKIKLGPAEGLGQSLTAENPESLAVESMWLALRKLVPEIYGKIMSGAKQPLGSDFQEALKGHPTW